MTIGEPRGSRWDSGLEYTTVVGQDPKLLPGVGFVEATLAS
jgi:hypothetical protein